MAKFDGTTSWSAFIQLFEFNAYYLDWSEGDACWALLNSLSGKATVVVPFLPPEIRESHSYERLRRWLQQRFEDNTDPRAAQHLLATRTQVSGESIAEFAKALEHLSLQAYPEDPQLAAAASLTAFLGGLNDVTVGAVLNLNPPADLASAVTVAKRVSYPSVRKGLTSTSAAEASDTQPGIFSRPPVRTAKPEVKKSRESATTTRSSFRTSSESPNRGRSRSPRRRPSPPRQPESELELPRTPATVFR